MEECRPAVAVKVQSDASTGLLTTVGLPDLASDQLPYDGVISSMKPPKPAKATGACRRGADRGTRSTSRNAWLPFCARRRLQLWPSPWTERHGHLPCPCYD